MVEQLTPVDNPPDFVSGSCNLSVDPGWCYVQGAAAGGCAQQIVFTASEPPRGATLVLDCTTP